MFINIHLESKKRQQNNIAFQVNVFVISQQFITFNTTQLDRSTTLIQLLITAQTVMIVIVARLCELHMWTTFRAYICPRVPMSCSSRILVRSRKKIRQISIAIIKLPIPLHCNALHHEHKLTNSLRATWLRSPGEWMVVQSSAKACIVVASPSPGN
jgi:hypothetical protein